MASVLGPQPAGTSGSPVSRTEAAVAAAMQQQLHQLDAMLLALGECRLPDQHPRVNGLHSHTLPVSMPSVATAVSELTLLRLAAESRDISERLLLLDAVTDAIAAPAVVTTALRGVAAAGVEPPADATARMIDGLQALLASRLLRGGPEGKPCAFCS